MQSGERVEEMPVRRSRRARTAKPKSKGRGSPRQPLSSGIQAADVSLTTMLEALRPHDHLCLIYESREEWRAAVVPFIAIGLQRNEKCVYVVDTSTADEIRRCLRKAGVDVSKAERAGQLSILHETEAYTREGSFDPDRMITMLISETEQAITAGYTALRVTGEMTWILRGHPGAERLLEYEAKLNRDLFPKYPCLAVCQYDRWRFDPEIIKGIIKTHPLLVRGNRVYRNFYFMPPEEFLAEKNADVEVQHWLNSLERQEKGERELLDAAKKLQAYFDRTLTPIMIVDENGCYMDANRAALEFLECSHEELLGKAVWDFAPPALRKKQKGEHARFYAPRMLETDYLVHGKVKTLLLNVVPLEIGGKRLLFGMGQDITARKQAEEAIAESERSYRTLWDSIIDGVVIIDAETLKLVLANNAALRMYGFASQEAAIGANLLDFIHPDEREKTARVIIEDMFQKDLRQVNQFRTVTGDGNEIWVEAVGVKTQYKGKLAGLVSFRDINERKLAEERLRQSEYLYRTAIESARDGILITDTNEHIVDANLTFVSSLGFGSREQVIGRSIGEYLTQEERGKLVQGVRASLRKTLREGKGYVTNLEMVALIQDGRKVPIEVNISRLVDSDGELTGFLHIVRDITERKHAEMEMQSHSRRLEALNAVSTAVSQSLDLDEMLKAALEKVLDVVGEQAGYVHFFDRQRKELVLRAHSGISAEYAASLDRIALTDEVVKRWEAYPEPAFKSNKILDGDSYRRAHEAALKDGLSDYFVAIPLWSKGRMHGGLSVVCRKARIFSDDELELLKAVGNVIAVGIENAGLYQEAKQALGNLSASEEKYRTLVEDINDGYVVLLGNKILFTNQSAARAMGRTAAEMWGKPFLQYLTPGSREVSRRVYDKTRRGEPVPDIWEIEFESPDGRAVPSEARIKEITFEGKRAYAVLLRDTTERRQAEEALRESEEKYRNLFNTSVVALYRARIADGKVLECNDTFACLVGYQRREDCIEHYVVARHYVEPDERRRLLAQLREHGEARSFEAQITRRDGSPLWINISAHMYPERDCIEGAVIDITDRKKSEERIRAYQSRLRSLASRLSLAEERERKRLAEGIHDLVSQPLAAAKLKIGALRWLPALAQASGGVDEIMALVEEAINQTRMLTFELSPPILYELGLEAALEWLADETQRKHGILCSFEDDGQSKPLGEDSRGVLFRIVSELLMNVVKHSQAHQVKVSIRRDDGGVRVRVEDDGVGFSVSEVERKTKGFGLFSIRQRLAELGGDFILESEPGSGTRVTVVAPLQAD